MKLNDISVSGKIWGSMLGVMLSLIAAAIWAQQSTSTTLMAAMTQVDHDDDLIAQAVDWRGKLVLATQRQIIAAQTTDTALSDSLSRQTLAASAEITRLQKAIAEAATTDADRQAMAQIGKDRATLLALRDKVTEARAQGGVAAAQQFVTDAYAPAVKVYMAGIDAFVALQQRQLEATQQEAQKAQAHVALVARSVAGLVVLAGLLWAAWLVRSIRQPLARAIAVAEATARGDLSRTITVEGRDEFGQLSAALAAMVNRLRELIGDVRQGAVSVSSASAQISAGNQDLSARTEHAASSLQQTAAAVEELTGQAALSLSTVRQATEIAGSTSDAAQQGGAIVERVVGSMGHISQASQRITDIIGVIDSIAFQTNILALNAAVEAARAGEHGRGFAVVASEVRQLARRSGEAAKEIKTLIGTSTETVADGMRMAGEAGAAMATIVARARHVSQLMDEMNAAAVEQSTGITQINTAVAQLDQTTQQNAALVEESAAAAKALRDQALRLEQAAAVFSVSTS